MGYTYRDARGCNAVYENLSLSSYIIIHGVLTVTVLKGKVLSFLLACISVALFIASGFDVHAKSSMSTDRSFLCADLRDSEWYYDAAVFCLESGMIEDIYGEFCATRILTHAECAHIIAKLRNMLYGVSADETMPDYDGREFCEPKQPINRGCITVP
jgi:hypothetical protein